MDIDEPGISEAVREAFSHPSAAPKSLSLVEFVSKVMQINEQSNLINFGQNIGEFFDDTFNEYRTFFLLLFDTRKLRVDSNRSRFEFGS
jgi:hypothetical protein